MLGQVAHFRSPRTQVPETFIFNGRNINLKPSGLRYQTSYSNTSAHISILRKKHQKRNNAEMSFSKPHWYTCEQTPWLSSVSGSRLSRSNSFLHQSGQWWQQCFGSGLNRVCGSGSGVENRTQEGKNYASQKILENFMFPGGGQLTGLYGSMEIIP